MLLGRVLTTLEGTKGSCSTSSTASAPGMLIGFPANPAIGLGDPSLGWASPRITSFFNSP